ncbi:MAG TPA: hypothetical protein DCR23_05595 [Ruminococcaceae bacterium]|nr:hypothetical protein [Oscillospiraceae bacterium]
MSYKNETMSEKDKEYLEKFDFHNYVTRRPLACDICTIDRDNKCYLLCAGGCGIYGNDMAMYYYFIINNVPLLLETFVKGTGIYSTGISCTWKITRIIVPRRLKAISEISNEEIIEKIKDALTASCMPIDGSCSVDASFEYIPPILFSDGEAVR